MKKDPKATAHALGIIAGVWYVLCVLWIIISKGSYMGLMSTWFHGIDFNALPSATPSLGAMTIGLITFVGFAWISGYFFAVIYNRLLNR